MFRILAAMIGFFMLAQAGTALAAGWRFDRAAAAMSYGEGAYRPSVRCVEPGRVAIVVPGNGARFDPGRSYTVTWSVDGLAFLLSAQPAFGAGTRTDFIHVEPMSQADALLTALARGRELEVAGPAGRYRLPLAGTAAALTALRAACGR